MSLRSYLALMFFTTLVCWLAFSYVIRTVNPEITNWVGFLLFYLSLFLSLSGTMAIVGFIVRFIGLRHEMIPQSVKAAFRQSFLFAFFITAILFLLSRNLFTWLNLILLIVFLSIFEFFLLSYNKGSIAGEEQNNSIEENKLYEN